MHWAARNSCAWYDAVGWAWKAARGKSPPKLLLDYPQFTYVFFQTRTRDWDGLAGASKILTDGLKVAGIIRNDSPADIPQPVLQEKFRCRADEHLEIRLEARPAGS